jgi:2-polyprenyl-6-methoxyphenol hydroxylase-like FAD-dependent oxidoreductase
MVAERTTQLRVAVVGAGIAGLAVASLLAKQGRQVTVFEKQAPLQPFGAGILLQPVALEVLHDLQILDAVSARGARIEHLARCGRDARGAIELHYAELGAHLHGLGVARVDLLGALLAAAGACSLDVRLGADVLALQEDSHLVHVLGTGCETTDEFDAAIVCNGVLSKLRAQLQRPAELRQNEWGVCTAMIASPTCHGRRTVFQWHHDADHYFGLLPLGENRATLFWNVRTTALERMLQQDFAAWSARARQFAP